MNIEAKKGPSAKTLEPFYFNKHPLLKSYTPSNFLSSFYEYLGLALIVLVPILIVEFMGGF